MNTPTSVCRILAGFFLFACAARALASSQAWHIVEVYSDASGVVQFIELEDLQNGDNHLTGLTLTSSGHTFTFPTDLGSATTAKHRMLLGTPGYVAHAGVPPVDYNLGVNNFVNIAGDTLNYGSGENTLTFSSGQLPVDGVKSLNRAYNPLKPTALSVKVNTPTDFAGHTGTALEAGKFVLIDLSHIVFKNGHDVTVDSAPQTIGSAFHYNFDISGHVQGVGPFASKLLPHGTLLAKGFNRVQPGLGDSFHGRIFMVPFIDTYPLVNETISGSAGPASISGTIASGVDNGLAQFQFKNVSLTIAGLPDNVDSVVFASDCRLLGYNADIIKSDFNVDGQSDLVLFDPKTRQVKIAFLKNSSFLHSTAALSIFTALGRAKLPAGFDPVAVGEFGSSATANVGDGYQDLVVFNQATATANVFFLKNMNLLSNTGVSFSFFIPAGFEIAGVGDFNVDQYTDLLLFNPTTQATEVVLLKGVNYKTGDATSVIAGPTIPTGYVVKGVSDFNDDGNPDLLLFNPQNLTTKCIFMNQATLAGATALGQPVDGPTLPAGYTLVGSGGFQDNRHVDLIIFNPTTRVVEFILLDGKTFTKTGTVKLGKLPPNLEIVAPR